MRKINRTLLVAMLGVFILYTAACGDPLLGEWAGSGTGTLTNSNGVFTINIASVTYNFKDDGNYTHTQKHTVQTPISLDFTVEGEGAYTYTGTDGGTVTGKPTSHKSNGKAVTPCQRATLTYPVDSALKPSWTHPAPRDTASASRPLERP